MFYPTFSMYKANKSINLIKKLFLNLKTWQRPCLRAHPIVSKIISVFDKAALKINAANKHLNGPMLNCIINPVSFYTVFIVKLKRHQMAKENKQFVGNVDRSRLCMKFRRRAAGSHDLHSEWWHFHKTLYSVHQNK